PPAQKKAGVAADADQFDLHLLALGQVKGVGVAVLRGLIDTFEGDLARVWQEDVPTVADVLARRKVPRPQGLATQIIRGKSELLEKGQSEREALARKQVRVLGMHQPSFPERLAEAPGAPYWLFVQGRPEALAQVPLIAIVGTRDATMVGRKTAARLAYL